VRLPGSIAFGILIAVLGYFALPSVFWDHGPYLFKSDRLEGALVVGLYGGVICYVANQRVDDSPAGLRAILVWIVMALIAVVWALREFTQILR